MSRKERFFNHIKGFQLVYAFAVVVFAAGVASTKIATAQDLKDLEARQDAANVKLITIMDDRFKV